ncbi:MAG: tRNA (adenosine(37)-N6)-threonylcarbamoyltransferase complex dimerization subunit type 1 TsaB [Planctomycetota bacterium]|jgi:tRNA threonylcarbamoyladenosine biosynthesis protein TsaB
MLVLAVDTSTGHGSVACGPIGDDGDTAHLLHAPLPLPEGGGRPVHGTQLAPVTQRLLSQGGWSGSEIDLAVIGLGPGSYTGIRIGLAFIKGIALAADCPMVGCSSLELLAYNAPDDAQTVVVVRDAKWGECYWARFQRRAAGAELARVTPDAVDSVTGLVLQPGDHCCGELGRDDAARLGAPRCADPADPGRRPDARVLARLGAARFRADGATPGDRLVPAYLRLSEAERKMAQRAAGEPGAPRQ